MEAKVGPNEPYRPVLSLARHSCGTLGRGIFAELLISCEEDRDPWAVLVGMLRDAER